MEINWLTKSVLRSVKETDDGEIIDAGSKQKKILLGKTAKMMMVILMMINMMMMEMVMVMVVVRPNLKRYV